MCSRITPAIAPATADVREVPLTLMISMIDFLSVIASMFGLLLWEDRLSGLRERSRLPNSTRLIGVKQAGILPAFRSRLYLMFSPLAFGMVGNCWYCYNNVFPGIA